MMKNCSVYIPKDTEVTSHNRLIRWVTNGRQCSAMQAPFARVVQAPFARVVCFEISRFRGGPTSYILTLLSSHFGKALEQILLKKTRQPTHLFNHILPKQSFI